MAPPERDYCAGQEKANQDTARTRKPVIDYDKVRNVTITRVNADTKEVHFEAFGIDDEPYEYGPYRWGDERLMWINCPSTLPSDAKPAKVGAKPQITEGELPKVDASGMLLLSRSWKKKPDPNPNPDALIDNSASRNTSSNVPIRGVDTDHRPKWPTGLGAGFALGSKEGKATEPRLVNLRSGEPTS
jgi:hypothetical protein